MRQLAGVTRTLVAVGMSLVLVACGSGSAGDGGPKPSGPLNVLTVTEQMEAGLAGPATEVVVRAYSYHEAAGGVVLDERSLQTVGSEGAIDFKLDAGELVEDFGRITPTQLIAAFFGPRASVTSVSDAAAGFLAVESVLVRQPDPSHEWNHIDSHNLYGERFAEESIGLVFPVHADRAVVMAGTRSPEAGGEPFQLTFEAGWSWLYMPFGSDEFRVAVAAADDGFVLTPYLDLLAHVMAPGSEVDGYTVIADHQLESAEREVIFEFSRILSDRKPVFAPRWLGPSPERSLLVELFAANHTFADLNGVFSVDPAETRGVMVSQFPVFDAEATGEPGWAEDLPKLGYAYVKSADGNSVTYLYSDRSATLFIDMEAPESGLVLVTDEAGLPLEMGWNALELVQVEEAATPTMIFVPYDAVPDSWEIGGGP